MNLFKVLLENYQSNNKAHDQEVLSKIVKSPVELLQFSFYDLSSSSHNFNPHLMISFNREDIEYKIHINFEMSNMKIDVAEYQGFGGSVIEKPYPEDFDLKINEVEVETDTDVDQEETNKLKQIFSNSNNVKELIQTTDLIDEISDSDYFKSHLNNNDD